MTFLVSPWMISSRRVWSFPYLVRLNSQLGLSQTLVWRRWRMSHILENRTAINGPRLETISNDRFFFFAFQFALFFLKYLLHDSHGVFVAASILSGLGDTHGRLEKNLDRALGHVVVAVEFLVTLFLHSLYHGARIGVKEIDEGLQHV